eukprot:CAMPEP_0185043098 /NCGR_PEP_ID=MMETSP1103-20130426/42718_1 /TAXON_ID=36769 /ORGANISM="Paraphysomonas bandaiensis, Strain Caron Lab Isolate" /LENGTH=1035 /DNA_ID=CAMNT_0027583241 /DNA_START=446 /DNA_END=3553 /DNA_ORIENTATION=-
MVLGSSIAAFNEICPNNFRIIHKSYRKLCHLLADLDEWTQVSVLDMMTRYARNQFTDPSPGRAAAARQHAKNRSTSASKGKLSAFTTVRRRVVKKAFYSDEEDESDEEVVILPSEQDTRAERGSVFTGGDADIEGDVDPDHRLLLRSTLPLLKSRNSGVVLGVCSLHYYCGSRSSSTATQMGKALVRILKNSREIQYVVLTSIITMAEEQPGMFLPYIQDFFVKATDPIFNRLLKLDVLAALTTKDNAELVLRELQTYVRHSNTSFVCATIRAVGRVADAAPSFAATCMEGLMHLIVCSDKPEVQGEAVVTLRQLLQQSGPTKAAIAVLHRLVKILLSESGFRNVPVARASVVWLVGEFHDVLRKVAPDILRILAKGFTDESTEAKTQIANFALKLSLRLPDDDNVQSLMTYVLEMTRYDTDIDLRDRSRFMTAMMGLAPSSGSGNDEGINEQALEELAQHAEGILLAPKLPPMTLQGPVDIDGLPRFILGSLSSIVGHQASGYMPIVQWPDVQPDSTVRDAVTDFESSQTLTRNKAEATKLHRGFADISSSSSDSDSDRGRKPKAVTMGARRGASSSSNSDSSSAYDSSDSESESDEDSHSSSEESEDDIPVPKNKATSSALSAGTITRMGIRKVATGMRKPQQSSQDSAPELDIFAGMSDGAVPEGGVIHSRSSLLDMSLDGLGEYDALDETSSPSKLPDDSFGVNVNQQGADVPTPPTQLSKDMNFSSMSTVQPDFATPPPTDDAAILASIMESFSVSSPSPAEQHSTVSRSQPITQRNFSNTVEEFLSVPKVILRPEVASGLQVSMVYRHGVRATVLPGGTCLFLEVKNCSKDYALRRVKVNFPGDIRRTPLEDIPHLAPDGLVKLPAEMILQPFIGKSVKVNITCDRGHFIGELMLEPYELLQPLSITSAEYASMRSRLGGFCHNTATIPLPIGPDTPASGLESWVETTIRSRLNVCVVQKGSATDEWQFVGCVRKEMKEERVLISLTIAKKSVEIRINADDAVMSATLLDYLRKAIVASGQYIPQSASL